MSYKSLLLLGLVKSLLSAHLVMGANTNSPELLPVPLVRQATTYSCGPAALLSVLYYWQLTDVGENELYAPLHTTAKEGTDALEIQKYLEKEGIHSELKEGTTLEQVRAALSKKEPVIVDFQAWPDKPVTNFKEAWDDGHFAVVVGMDAEKIYFMDPSLPSGYGFLTQSDFMDRWHDVETRLGEKVKNYQLAIFVHGKNPVKEYPVSLKKIE